MPQSPVDIARREAEQAEVRAVLAALSRSHLMVRLFSYLCDKYFDGEAEQLSELKIAIDVFGRSETFDRNQDSIARVEAHRLRKKLKQYYELEGKNHSIQIELPAGSYVPVFQHKARVTQASNNNIREEVLQDGDGPPALGGTPPEHQLNNGRRSPFQWWYVFAAALACLVLFAAARTFHKRMEVPAPPGEGSRSRVAYPSAPFSSDGSIRFLCGYEGPPHIGRLGEVWGPDRYFNGGRPWPDPRVFLRRTNDPFLFQNVRSGEFSYDIPVKPGYYELHLYFVENDYGEELGGGENSRTFSIWLNKTELIQTFDVLSDAGGPRIADERVFKDVQPASDGKVHISVESQRGEPIINAIELIPGIPHRQLPIRLVTQGTSYTDHSGRIWAPDNYYLGGQSFTARYPSTAQGPVIFSTERAGNFSYAIPVDLRSTYTANLYFEEVYFGPAASGTGGAGSRVFNVMCNGIMLLDHFDMFKEVGSLQPIEKSFHGLKPSAQGKLVLTFQPVANYASVFAIEILDESK